MLTYLHALGKKLNARTRINVTYALRAGIWMSAGQAVGNLSSLLLTFFLVKFISQADYGNYVYIISLLSILSSISLTGLETSVAQAVAKGHDATLFHATRYKFLWSLPASGIALSLALYYSLQGNSILGASLLIISFYVPFINSIVLYTAYLNGKKNFRLLALESSLKNILVASCVLGIAYTTQNVVLLILVYTLVTLIISGVFYVKVFREVKKKIGSTTDTEATSFGTHLSFMNFLSVISTYADRVVVFQFLGATTLAHYALAYAPVRQVLSLSKMVGTIALPKFATQSRDEIRKHIHRKALLLFFVTLSIFLTYIVVAPYFFRFVFPEYTDSILLTQVMSIGVLFIPCNLYMQAFFAHQRKKELYVMHVCKAVSKIALLSLLLPLFGIWGAAFAFLGTQAISNGLVYYYFHYRF